jgi:hypothetical protein
MKNTLQQRMLRRHRHDRALMLAMDALALYADPTSYHAVAFIADRPAGWFADDISFDENYMRKVPGKKARETLDKIQEQLDDDGR